MNDTPPALEGTGLFADGVTAMLKLVSLKLDAECLRMTLPDGDNIEWPYNAIRLLPDQADRATHVLGHADDPVARLMLKDGPFSLALRQRCRFLKKRAPIPNLPRLIRWAVGAVASVALIVFVLVPLMADQLAEFLPPEGERALGDATFDQIREALSKSSVAPIGVCEQASGLAAISAMQARLDPGEDLPYPIQVHVLDHELVNAFALPGGRIILFRGLIEAAANAEEVGAVLAHEIGHVIGRDPTRDALRSAGSIGVLGLLFGDFAGGTVVLWLANQLINASYSQEAETAADTYAHRLLTETGLSPAALGTMFERLRAKYGDAEGIVAHFASHPQMAARIEASLAAAEGVVVDTPLLTEAEWQALRGICRGGVEPAPTPSDPPEDDGGEGRQGSQPDATSKKN
jgi:Zn-dependent protease with chaperone function